MALQSIERLVIGGQLKSVDGDLRPAIARLNMDGSLDRSFGTGLDLTTNGTVWIVALQRTMATNSLIVFTQTNAPSQNPTTNIIETGTNSGVIYLEYDFSIGSNGLKIRYDGSVIFDTGLASGRGMITVAYGPGTSSRLAFITY